MANPDNSLGVERPPCLGVCHLASGDLWAGAEVQIAALLKSLAREGRLRLSAIVLNPGRLAQELRTSGVDTRIIPENQKGLLAIANEAVEFLRGKNIQILHSHRYKENLLAGLLARRCRIPFLVQTLHGMPEPLKGLAHLRHRLIRLVEWFLSRQTVDRVISVSPEMTRQLRGRVPSQKLVTIVNGVDPESVRADLSAAEAKVRLGISPNHQVIGTAGRLEPIKRLDIFLRAAAQIAAAVPWTSFVISGDGRERKRLEELAGQLGIGHRVLFLGHRDDIYDVLRSFDVLVMCADHEGLPMVLLEALALGLIVVARAVGGIPEVIQDSENGILVKSDDPALLAAACLRILGDADQRRRLSDSGPKSINERFSVQRTAAQVVELYRSLADSR